MEKFKAMFCVWFGHSRIVKMCFGYVSCARCYTQIGDRLAGVFNLEHHVIVGHDCDYCKENYKALGWKDKLLVPNPFKGEEYDNSDRDNTKDS